MRTALLGLLAAPLALLSSGVESKAYPAMDYVEPLECAVIGNDRVMRSALGCPTMVPVAQLIVVEAHSEPLECAVIGNNRMRFDWQPMMRAALGCPMY